VTALKTADTGFTLAEVALVLVVVGLLLGGIVKTQEMVVQSKIKHVIADINGVSAAMYAYHDRYRALNLGTTRVPTAGGSRRPRVPAMVSLKAPTLPLRRRTSHGSSGSTCVGRASSRALGAKTHLMRFSAR
jgi:prepilin-type N-terminal cleavage/methylation domain-containing protein